MRKHIIANIYILLFINLIACKDNNQTAAYNPSYLKIYSAEDKPDMLHVNIIYDYKGNAWYIEDAPVFNLNAFYLDTVVATIDRDNINQGEIHIYVKQECNDRLSSWSNGHIGKRMAIIVEKEHTVVLKVEAELRTVLRIPGILGKDKMKRIYEAMKNGGK